MKQLWYLLDGTAARSTLFTPQGVLLSLLMAFVLGQLLAWVYTATHSGMSYSRSFVQSLILIAIVVSLVMAVIGNSIITAFGLMGALALVRFRNVIKDTRDVVFIFFALVIGMGAGSQRYAVAVVGTIVMCVIAIYLHLTAFGSQCSHNAFLRFGLPRQRESETDAPQILRRFCHSYTLISVQEDDSSAQAEYAYQLVLRDSGCNAKMMAELNAIPEISNISLTMQEELLEV